MFHILKKKQMDNITSPVIGKCIPLKEVPDKVFANKLMGDGVGFVFEGDTIYAPCSGEIIMIAQTKHAFAIRTVNGTEVLLHIGLDTVNLNGQGLQILVSNNERVKAGEPLLRINREMMNERKIDLTIPLIITNMQDYNLVIRDSKEVDLSSIVIQTKKK